MKIDPFKEHLKQQQQERQLVVVSKKGQINKRQARPVNYESYDVAIK